MAWLFGSSASRSSRAASSASRRRLDRDARELSRPARTAPQPARETRSEKATPRAGRSESAAKRDGDFSRASTQHSRLSANMAVKRFDSTPERSDGSFDPHESKFAFLHWVRSPTPPFSNTVTHADGRTKLYGTRERPKLSLDADGHPNGLFNAVIGGELPWVCKDTPGVDWSFTLFQPIGRGPAASAR